MSSIKILPEILINQIAAGEVIERPASVVKELIENSLDADAKRIKVEVELGGRRLMRISDNGIGMSRDEAILAFERHATSKIQKQEDLGNISTLGFRGEALASISSVARVNLTTKAFDAGAATRVEIEGGKMRDVADAAHPTGTTIEVRDLFFNTPARRKFMRSQATENYHITNAVTHFALANPEIAFSLINNGRETIAVSPAKDLRERAFQLFGRELISSLLQVNGGREFVARVSGFISAPKERRTSRDSQYFFINGRFVRDKIIAAGLREGFRSVLPHGAYPVAFLFLDIPVEEIDVNVHPAKTEVRFRRTDAVKEVISEAVRKALTDAGIIRKNANQDKNETPFENEFTETGNSVKSPPEASPNKSIGNDSEKKQESEEQTPLDFEIPAESDDFESAARIRTIQTEEQEVETSLNSKEVNGEDDKCSNSSSNVEPSRKSLDAEDVALPKSYDVIPPFDSAATIPKSIETGEVSAQTIQPIGQLHNSFIVAADESGLLLIDQHVAHERILFDRFRSSENSRHKESQPLLLPETFDLTPAQAEVFDEISDELIEAGFETMKLSGRTLAVKAVPIDLPPDELRNLFSEILETTEPEKRGNARATIRDEIAASLACKAAVKINMPLTMEKMRWMIDRLLVTSSPTTCPHGRPVILRLTMGDIERKFHRT